MRLLPGALSIIDSISEYAGKAASFLIVGITLEMMYEVVARYAFTAPTEWSYETTIFLFGSYIIFAGAYTLRHRAHVNVDLFYSRFRPRGKAILDILTASLFFLYAGILSWKGLEFGWTSVSHFEHTDSLWSPPIYFFKMALPVGAWLITLQGLAKLVRDFHMAITGREIA